MTDSKAYQPSSTHLLLLTIVLAAIRYWIPLLSRELWVDESITWWVSNSTISEAIRKGYQYQSNWWLYFALTWAWQQVAPLSELAQRLPNVVLGIATCVFFYLTARRLFQSPLSALVASALLATSPPLVDAVANYRPYALILCFLSVSAYLLSGSDLPKRKVIYTAGFFWGCAAALNLVYLASIVLIVVVFFWGRFANINFAQLSSSALRFLLAAALPIASSLPTILANVSRKDMLVLHPHLSFIAYLDQTLSGQDGACILVGTITALILSTFRGGIVNRLKFAPKVTKQNIAILGVLCLTCSCSAYFFDHVLNTPVAVSRYWMWRVFPEALFITAFFGLLLRGRELLIIVPIALLISRPTTSFNQMNQITEFGNAFLQANPSCEFVAQSGVIESSAQHYYQSAEGRAYLATPFVRYPLVKPFRVVALRTITPLDPSPYCALVVGYSYPDFSEKGRTTAKNAVASVGGTCSKIRDFFPHEIWECHQAGAAVIVP